MRNLATSTEPEKTRQWGLGSEATVRAIGIVPARMDASRFPGKPLYPINGKPMLQHVFERASLYERWDELVVATCDDVIAEFAKTKGYPVLMTGSHHARALDRVAEAAEMLGADSAADDIVVCIQADEPLLTADMFPALIEPLVSRVDVQATVLAMQIADEDQWRNPDTVKIIANAAGEVLYTSRAAVPYSNGAFSPEMAARRIFGLFAFRAPALKAFTEFAETRLEQLEACESNRILDMGFRQHIAPFPAVPAFSVDSPEDIILVEDALRASERA